MHKALAGAIVLATGLIGCASSPPRQFLQSAYSFTPCASAPHCVSSQAPRDSGHYVEPLTFAGDAANARDALLATIRADDNASLVTTEDRFIHATFRSTLGFVDDVTFLMRPGAAVIDVKSSSRIGYYDFGVNRKRVEHLRKAFEARLARG